MTPLDNRAHHTSADPRAYGTYPLGHPPEIVRPSVPSSTRYSLPDPARVETLWADVSVGARNRRSGTTLRRR